MCYKVLQELIRSCPTIAVFNLHLGAHCEQATKQAFTSTENNIVVQSVSSPPDAERVSAIPEPILSNILVYVPGK